LEPLFQDAAGGNDPGMTVGSDSLRALSAKAEEQSAFICVHPRLQSKIYDLKSEILCRGSHGFALSVTLW
jgi:hypothetical protein